MNQKLTRVTGFKRGGGVRVVSESDKKLFPVSIDALGLKPSDRVTIKLWFHDDARWQAGFKAGDLEFAICIWKRKDGTEFEHVVAHMRDGSSPDAAPWDAFRLLQKGRVVTGDRKQRDIIPDDEAGAWESRG